MKNRPEGSWWTNMVEKSRKRENRPQAEPHSGTEPRLPGEPEGRTRQIFSGVMLKDRTGFENMENGIDEG